MSTRYIIIGAGAVGSHLAGKLTLAGIPAVLVARGAQLEALRHGPLILEGLESTDEVPLTVVGGPDEVDLTSDDILVLATKTQDAEAAINDWAWLPVDGASGVEHGQLSADLPLATFQNGIASETVALRRFARTIPVGTIVPASYLDPGHVVSLTSPKAGFFQVGALPHRAAEDAEVVERIATDLAAAGYLVKTYDDVTQAKTMKLLHNILNGVDVLEGTPEEKASLSNALVAEAQDVYREAGIASEFPEGLDVDLGAAFGTGAFSDPRAPRRSTWQSFSRGRSSEVDYLNGEIVLIARRHGIDAPLNERLQRVLGVSHRLGEQPQTRRVSEVLAAATAKAR